MTERKFLYLSTEGYSQEHDATVDELTLKGLTMAGAIDMQSTNKVTSLSAATSSGDALSYGQSGASLAGLAVTGDITMANNHVTGLPATPSGDTAAASKAYVDGVAAGLDWKESVRAATDAAGTLADDFDNGKTIDTSVTLATGDRILIKDQSTASENGIYIVVADGTPTRATDLAAGDQAAGVAVFVEEGTDNADAGFVCTSNETADTVGTHALNWTQFTGLGDVTAGSGLTKDGNTLNVGEGWGVSVGADSIAAKPDTTGTSTTSANAVTNQSGGIGVRVDDSTIEGSNQGGSGQESLRLKAGGITGSHLASNIAINTSGNIETTAGVFTGDGSGLSNLPGAASTDAVTISAKKSTAGTINKGQVVYIVGYSSPDHTVELSDADNSATMPAIGVASSTITDAAAGTVVMSGAISGMDTDTWSVGDELYVSTTAGTLVATKPTGVTSQIQKVAQVVVDDVTVGRIQVFGAGRVNDSPNIAEDALWIGNASAVPTSTAVGNGLVSTPGTSLAAESDTTSGGNIEPINVAANGLGLNVSNIAGTSLEADGSANLRIAAAAAGDGLEGGGASALSVHLEASNPSLQIATDELGIKFDASGGLQKAAGGTGVKIDDTPDTLDVDSDGLKVVGLPSTFKVNDVATDSTVTAANLSTLCDTSNADSLHTHTSSSISVDEAPKIETTVTVNEDVDIGSVLCWSSTTGRVAKALSGTDALARVVGVARTNQDTPGQSCEMVSHGLLDDVLTAQTPGAPQYLSATGTISASLPAAGHRIILVGYAQSATDLWVSIRDYGKSAS